MKTRTGYFFSLILISWNLLFTGCFSSISKNKGITYLTKNNPGKEKNLQLDIFSRKDLKEPKEVFIFLHGGGWNKGKRSNYSFLGKRMTKKGIVSVIMDYPLAPDAEYNEMAAATSSAVKWVKENISKYGGNPEKIFISGHSAGGHLAALVCVQKKYFDSLNIKNPIKGVILIDAAGLDMYTYLKEREETGKKIHYLEAFTKEHDKWKDASPVYHVHKDIPPMLMFTGGKTYPNIKTSNERFVSELTENNIPVIHRVLKGKRHIPMIFQLYNSNNQMYEEMIRFMKEEK